MAEAVIILGAGASADFGVPVLRTLFRDRWATAYLQSHPWLHEQLDGAFWKPRGHSQATSDQSLTVEEMLTIVVDCERQGQPCNLIGIEEAQRFRRELNVLIFQALYMGKSTAVRHLNPLIHFARARFTRITWATFNWDCIFESSYYYSSGGPEPYARSNPNVAVTLANFYPTLNSPSTFLKLHGGINWWVVNGTLTYFQFGGGTLRQQWERYAAGQLPATDFPVILEPSFYKYEDEPRYALLHPQWEYFEQRLNAANLVLMVGYSLNPLDTLARRAIMMAFQKNATARWVAVDPSEDVLRNYSRLLGRDRFSPLQMTLAGLNNDLVGQLEAVVPGLPPAPAPPAPAAPAAPA